MKRLFENNHKEGCGDSLIFVATSGRMTHKLYYYQSLVDYGCPNAESNQSKAPAKVLTDHEREKKKKKKYLEASLLAHGAKISLQ